MRNALFSGITAGEEEEETPKVEEKVAEMDLLGMDTPNTSTNTGTGSLLDMGMGG